MTTEETNEKTFSSRAPKVRADENVAKTNPNLTRKKPSKYFNVNDLEIPEDIEHKFRKGGFALRYVRFIKPGTTNEMDYQNIGKKIQQGYTFVTTREVPSIAITSFKRDINVIGLEGGEFKDVVVKGDLALMKIPLENVEERRKQLADINRNAMMAVDMDAKRHRLHNESRTTVTSHPRGTPRNDLEFQDD